MSTFYENYSPQGLRIHSDLLLALSSFFAEGGEKIPHTLGPLVRSCTPFSNHFKLENLQLPLETLLNCSKADRDEYRLMTYEFNRLFVGPTAPLAPLYESVYLSPDHLIMGEQTLAVRKIYQQENLQAQGHGHEPDDFIATELEFTAYLLSRIMEAQDTMNDIKIQHYKDLYHDFWEQHPSLWLGLFAQRLRQSTHHPVFSALSEVLDTLTTLHTH
ncbi:TorD/DmsD family molecular chaperone [Desulfosporosinus fructosivorans]|uniref:TorD/DmsD family molecular chaperone n=1 Tax=Desulfosporosinus fructosivorans TaxID=2018669 RepID=UPI00130E28FC|nr:molecular chaperone TorD family protein [Desulfosporosinus fructosivorans]